MCTLQVAANLQAVPLLAGAQAQQCIPATEVVLVAVPCQRQRAKHYAGAPERKAAGDKTGLVHAGSRQVAAFVAVRPVLAVASANDHAWVAAVVDAGNAADVALAIQRVD